MLTMNAPTGQIDVYATEEGMSEYTRPTATVHDRDVRSAVRDVAAAPRRCRSKVVPGMPGRQTSSTRCHIRSHRAAAQRARFDVDGSSSND
jgi:hypothetical protein